MKRFEFNKPILESSNPPSDINMLWIDIDENTKMVKWIKEYNKITQQWEFILDNDYDIEPQRSVNIVENGTINIIPSQGYNALEKVVINTNVPAQKSTFAIVKDFGDVLTEISGFTEEMNTPVTDYIHDKKFPVEIRLGTTGTIYYGTLVSAYDNTNSYQSLFYTDNSQLREYERVYNISTRSWGEWEIQ